MPNSVESAQQIDGFPRWDAGDPMPRVVADEGRVYLVYRVAGVESWQTGATGASPPIALITFERAAALRFGSPNDEALDGHPLWGRGLVPYGAHLVSNSRWIAELAAINSAHPRHDPSKWMRRNHYMLCFHDSTFECIAERFSVEDAASIAEATAMAVARLRAD